MNKKGEYEPIGERIWEKKDIPMGKDIEDALRYVDKNFKNLLKKNEPILDVFMALMRAYEKYDEDIDLILPLELALERLYKKSR